MTVYDIVDRLIKKSSYNDPITAERICSFFPDSDRNAVIGLLEENVGKPLVLGASIRQKGAGYYAELPFSETDIVILRSAILSLPYCERRQTAAITEHLNDFLPEYMREYSDNFQTGSEPYSGTFYDNLFSIIKALYPVPGENGTSTAKKVSFEYYEYNEYAELVAYRKKEKIHQGKNPLKIICMNNFFYLVTYYWNDETNKIGFINYRIDRMKNVVCTDDDVDSFADYLRKERQELLRLKERIDKERNDAHNADRIYFEPKSDPIYLDVSQRIDDRGFNVGEYIQRSKWMFTDRKYDSAVIRVKKIFMNTIVDTFGFNIDVITSDGDTAGNNEAQATLRVYNVSETSLINLALQFPGLAEVISAEINDPRHDNDHKPIRTLISEKISRLSEIYSKDYDNDQQ